MPYAFTDTPSLPRLRAPRTQAAPRTGVLWLYPRLTAQRQLPTPPRYVFAVRLAPDARIAQTATATSSYATLARDYDGVAVGPNICIWRRRALASTELREQALEPPLV